jgi:hypothetical protein
MKVKKEIFEFVKSFSQFSHEIWNFLFLSLGLLIFVLLFVGLYNKLSFDPVFFSNELYKFILSIIGYTYVGILTNFIVIRAQQKSITSTFISEVIDYIRKIGIMCDEYFAYYNEQIETDKPNSGFGKELFKNIGNSLDELNILFRNTQVVNSPTNKIDYAKVWRETKEFLQNKTETEKHGVLAEQTFEYYRKLADWSKKLLIQFGGDNDK